MIYQYQWRIPKYPVSAETAGQHLEHLDRQHGAVTPKILLEDSRPTNATLHSCFEWDNEKAAEKYRIVQARDIIGNLVFVAIPEDEEPLQEPIRAFVSVSGQKESGAFRPVAVALSDAEMRKQVLENAMKDLQDFKRKYTALDELNAVLTAIDETIKSVMLNETQ